MAPHASFASTSQGVVIADAYIMLAGSSRHVNSITEHCHWTREGASDLEAKTEKQQAVNSMISFAIEFEKSHADQI